MLTEAQKNQLTTSWKHEHPLTLSMTFVGTLQCDESPEVICQKLERAQQHSVELTAKQRLQEEGGEPQELPPSIAASADDFVEVTYRALSAATLADRPIDFTNEKMLKRAVRLLKGQTVFKDHETSVDNWVGRVADTFWDEQTKGFPPGINALLKLDAIKDPMTVRGVVQGVIHSASVTVSFEWKPSHPKLMDDGSFFERLGEDVDGEEVRIVVTKIDRFLEISLVWQGADMFAKQIGDNGKPVQRAMQADSLPEIGQLSLSASRQLEKEDVMNPLKKILDETFGTEVNAENFPQVLAAHLEKSKSELTSKADQHITKLVDQLNEASKSVNELKTQIATLEPQAALGSKYLEDERSEAIRLCKLVKGETINEAILKTLEDGDLKLVQAWKAEFQKEAESKFPTKCAKCGSSDVRRQSSQQKQDSKESDETTSVLSKQTSSYVRDLHGG